MLVQELEPLLRLNMTLDVIIFQDADGAIDFQDRQRHILNAVDSVLPQSALDLIQRNVFFTHVGGKQASAVDQQRGGALNHAAKPPVEPRQFRQQVIQYQQDHGGSGPAEKGSVRPGHGVLDGVAEQQEEREIERRHLPYLPLAGEPDADQYQKINDRGARHDLDYYVPICEHVE